MPRTHTPPPTTLLLHRSIGIRSSGVCGPTFETEEKMDGIPLPDLACMMHAQRSPALHSSPYVPTESFVGSHDAQHRTYDSEDIAPTQLRGIIGVPRQAMSNSERDRINKRRRQQRTHERSLVKEMVNTHAEQRQPSFPIPTDVHGKAIGLKTKWHNSVRSIARNIVRWDIRKYKQHPTEWNWIITSVICELDNWYTYEPYPLSRLYVSKYLSQAIADDRNE
jgi:hypothetical protein